MGVVGRPHGVRGLVRLLSHASSPDVLAEHALTDERGRAWRVTWRGEGIAALTEIATGRVLADRDAAAALTNLRLHVDRALLPPTEEDEFYLADLEGLEARNEAGVAVGRVVAVHDYGAGTSLEIGAPDGRTRLVPFTRAAVPAVDIAGGTLTVAELDEIEIHDETDPDAVAAAGENAA